LAVPRWLSAGLVDPTEAEMYRISPDIRIYPRSTWMAFTPRLAQLRPAKNFTRLTVHHAGNGVNLHLRQEDVVLDLNGILEAHLQNHYGDIGYHFMIDRAGRIWEGRSLAYEGAHVAGMNMQNIGVMLLGNFDEQKPAAEQVSALFMLVDVLLEKYDISGEEIYGHCDLAQSACPGRNLYEPYLGELRQS
jgi:hypothetical protein